MRLELTREICQNRTFTTMLMRLMAFLASWIAAGAQNPLQIPNSWRVSAILHDLGTGLIATPHRSAFEVDGGQQRGRASFSERNVAFPAHPAPIGVGRHCAPYRLVSIAPSQRAGGRDDPFRKSSLDVLGAGLELIPQDKLRANSLRVPSVIDEETIPRRPCAVVPFAQKPATSLRQQACGT